MRARLWDTSWASQESLRSFAFLLLSVGIAIIAVLHALRPDVHPAQHYISEYGNEAWSWLMTLAGLLIGLGLLALAAGLRDVVRARTGPMLVRGSGVLMVMAALFSTDRHGGEVVSRTLGGRLHGLVAIGAFCLLVLAMAALSSRAHGGREPLGRLSALALPAALAAVALAAVAFMLVPDAHGLRQRAFLVIVFGWILATAFQLRSLDRGQADASPASVGPARAED